MNSYRLFADVLTAIKCTFCMNAIIKERGKEREREKGDIRDGISKREMMDL